VSAPSPWNNRLTGVRLAKQNYAALYAQDEWHLRPNLTLNYGLRYEYYTVMKEDKNRDVIFNIITGQIDPSYNDFYDSSKLNFGPRLGLSWSPQAMNGKTVFCVGAGYYYGPGQTEDQIQPIESDRASRTLTSGVAYPINPQAILGSFNINNPNLGFQPRAYAPGYLLPEKVLSYTTSIQQEFGGAVLTVAYVGSQGRNLFLRSIANRITGVSTNPNTGQAIIQRQFGNRFAEVDYKTSGGTDHYDSLQVTFNRRFRRGLTLASQYTWGHSIGDSDGSNEARTAAIYYDFAADRGNNNFDVRQSFNFSALYDLPFGAGHRFDFASNRAADLVLEPRRRSCARWLGTGWDSECAHQHSDRGNIVRPDVVYRDNRTGLIYTSPVKDAAGRVVSTALINVPGGGASRNVRRPDVVAGVNPYLPTTRGYILNPAAFAVPAPGTFGNLARNALSGPSLAQLDLTLSKRFRLAERINLELRGEL
jgi:TonB dependent receptor